MTGAVTDPAMLDWLERNAQPVTSDGAVAPATTNATPEPAPPSGASPSAQDGQHGAVSDPALLGHLEKTAVPVRIGGGPTSTTAVSGTPASSSANIPADAVPGPNGLLWNAAGGHDPKTGELVIAGKPFSDPTTDHPVLSKIIAGAEGILGGVPVAGPSLAAAPVKAAAALRSAVSGTPVDQTLAGTQGIVSSAEAANPGIVAAGNVAGAVAGTVPLAETALGARGLGLVGGWFGRGVQGAAGGAALGAGDAYMRGRDPKDAAITGAILGGSIPVVGSAIGAAARTAMNAAPAAITGPLSSLNQTARNMLAQAVQGETPATIDAAHAALGPSGFVGDLNNPLSRLTKSIHDQPDQAAGDVKTAYNQRAAADGGRIESAVTDAIGPRQNLTLITKNDKIAQSQAADPLYDAWRNTQVPPTDELRALTTRLNAAGVSGSAANKMAISGTPGYQQWFKTDPLTGQLTLDTEASPTAQTFDYIKQALDDKIGSAINSGERGNARLYQGLKSDLVSAVDNHPDPNVAGVWQQARQAWADPQSIMNAREWGADALKNGTTVDDLREQWGNLSPPERVAAVQGMRGQIANVFGGTKNGDTLIKNQLLAPNAQDKLSFMVGPQKSQDLTAALQQEDALAASAKKITGGSPTHENMQAAGLSGISAIPGNIQHYVGSFDATRPATWIPGFNADDLISGHEGVKLAAARAQIAPILTTPNGPNADMARQLLNMATTQTGRNARAAQLQNMATMLMGTEARRRMDQNP